MSDTEKFIRDAAFENWWSGLKQPHSGRSQTYRYVDGDILMRKHEAKAVWMSCWSANDRINKVKRDFFWLIETNPNRYFSEVATFRWTCDASLAAKFATKEEAELRLKKLFDEAWEDVKVRCAFVAEHGFICNESEKQALEGL